MIWRFIESLRSRCGVLTFAVAIKAERHAYYNLIRRPAGLDETLKAIIDESAPALGAVVPSVRRAMRTSWRRTAFF